MSASRNRREGGYLGRYRSVYDAYDDRAKPRRRNHRKGASQWNTLREWRKLA